MFRRSRIKGCSRLFPRPLSSLSGGKSARIIPTLNVKLSQNLFLPEISFNLLQVQSMNRALSTVAPKLSEKISPEIEQLLEISLEERSLEEEDSTNGVRLAKCSHTTSFEMFIKSIVEKYIDFNSTNDWKNLHLRDTRLKFRILNDVENSKDLQGIFGPIKFGNVDLANISTVLDIFKVLDCKSLSKNNGNPWTKYDSFKDHVLKLVENGKWPENVVFKERVERDSNPIPASKIPLY